MNKILLFIALFFFLLTPQAALGVTLITDDFAGTANPIGGSWVTQSGGYVDIQKVSGRARGTNTGATARAYYNSAISADQWAQATITTRTDSESGGLGVTVRAASGADTFYSLLAYVYLGNHYYFLAVKVAGTSTDLYFTTEPWVVGDIMRLEAQGTTLRMYRNGIQIGSDITDSAIASGFVGIGIDGVSDLSTAELDDFSAGDFSVTPGVAKRPIVVVVQ